MIGWSGKNKPKPYRTKIPFWDRHMVLWIITHPWYLRSLWRM